MTHPTRRRRGVVAATYLAGTRLLGVSLATPPGSTRFYTLTLTAAGAWIVGGVASGPVPVRGRGRYGPVLVPLATGAAAFGVFYVGAVISRRIPPLNKAIFDILQYSHQGATPLVLLTTVANGCAEEIFFRGALYSAVGDRYPVLASTAAYALTTTATRNPALVLASLVMGTLFGLQRRATGGVQAPMLTHLTWSTLMVTFLPPLFRRRRPPPVGSVVGPVVGSG